MQVYIVYTHSGDLYNIYATMLYETPIVADPDCSLKSQSAIPVIPREIQCFLSSLASIVF